MASANRLISAQRADHDSHPHRPCALHLAPGGLQPCIFAANACTHPDHRADGCGAGHSACHGDPHTYADPNGATNLDDNANRKPITTTYTDAHAHAYIYFHGDGNPHANANRNEHARTDSNKNASPDSNKNSQTDKEPLWL